jgi:hypothetical protein
MLSRRCIVDFGVVVGTVADISAVHATSIFKDKVSRGNEVQSFTRPTYLDPEDRRRMYLQNVGNNAHFQAVQTPKSRTSI